MSAHNHHSAAPSQAPLLSELGEALFGPQWQSPLARELSVNLRTVQRWAAGRFDPDMKTMRALLVMVERRQGRVARVISRARQELA